MPLGPTELGAPAVPAGTKSTADKPVPYADAVAPYAKFGTDAKPGEFPRTIRHNEGETVIEERPKRVVVLDVGELDAVMQLGVIPVGAAEYSSTAFPKHIIDKIKDVKLVGNTQELNLEAIAELAPDLILSSSLRHKELYETLSKIAPTVFSTRPGVAFRHNFALYAQSLGLEEKGAEVVKTYEDKVREVNAAMPKQRPATSIVQLRPEAPRFYLRANFLGLLLTDVGIPRPDSENIDDFAFDLSRETIPDYANGDVVILAVAGGDKNEFAKSVLDSALWKGIPAVKNNKVFSVDSETWIGGVGYGSAFIVLDEIKAYYSKLA